MLREWRVGRSSGRADWEPAAAPTVEAWDTTRPTRKELDVAEAIRVSAPVSGTDKTLSFETGKLALQSQGAVVASAFLVTRSMLASWPLSFTFGWIAPLALLVAFIAAARARHDHESHAGVRAARVARI